MPEGIDTVARATCSSNAIIEGCQKALEEAKKLAKELEEKEVVLAIKTGSDGRVFGSVSTKEIAEAAKEQLGYELDKKKMHLKDAIKSIGTFHVPVKLHPKVTVELKVVVKEK